MRRCTVLIILTLIAGCLASLELPAPNGTIAKAQAKCGGIEGRVTTPEGWMIPMVKIFFVDKQTKKTTSVETNEDGEYEACLLPGTFDVSVNAVAFKNAKRKNIKVVHGERRVIDFPLKRGKPVTSDQRSNGAFSRYPRNKTFASSARTYEGNSR